MINYWIARIGLIFTTLFFVNSCAIQQERPIINRNSETPQGQIFLWVEIPFGLEAQSREDQKVIKDTIEEFTQLYPQVQVFIRFLPMGNTLESFDLQFKRGAGPDLLLGYYGSRKMFHLINTGLFRALDESEVDQSEFRSEVLKHVRYQGRFYGLPQYLITQVLCYNKNKVTELPRTLPQLIEQARRGYSVGVHSGFVETFWGTGIFGGQVFDDQGRFILDQRGGWAKWMEWLKRAQNEPNFILSNNAEALQQAFVDGKLAYLTCSSSWIPYFRDKLGKGKLGVTVLPGEVNKPATPVLWTGAFLFNRASSPNQQRLALKLAQFLTNVEQQNQIQAAIPFIPSNKNVTINRQLFPIRAALLDQSKSGIIVPVDDAQTVEVIVEYGEILYQQILAGSISPEKAATEFSLTINRKLGGE